MLKRILLIAACAATLVNAEIQECMDAFSSLAEAPNNVSVPFFYSATGAINTAYLYQKPVFTFFPAAAVGGYDMCINAGIFTDGTMEGKYCSVAGNNAGMCVPSACTAEDLNDQALAMHLVQVNIAITSSMPFDCWLDPYLTETCANANILKKYIEAIYPFLVDIPGLEDIDCENGGVKADRMSHYMLGFISVTTAFALIAATWDYMRNDSVIAGFYNRMFSTTSAPAMDKSMSESDRGNAELSESRNKVNNFPVVPTFLDCFNLSKNWSETLSLNTRGGEFSCFDGMRALSCWWVIIYHVILWQVGYMDNPMSLLPPNGILGQWWSAPFFNFTGTYSVETFFFISSFLAVFLLMSKLDKEAKSKEGPKSVLSWMPSMYIHRFLRVLPAYAFTLFVHWKVAPLFSSGPAADHIWAFNTKACEEQWWKHLLFVNDITPWLNQRFGNICFGHTWYLANDMQFFLMVPLFVVLYRQSSACKKIAITGLLGIVGACIGLTWNLSYENDWSPSTWDAKENTHYREEGFSRPWIRITPYALGMIFGFIWYEKKQWFPAFKFSLVQRFVILGTSLAIFAACMFGPYQGKVEPCVSAMGQTQEGCGSGMNMISRVALLSLGRPAWSIALGLLSLLCWNGQGGYINNFLSAPIWTPISNLSFTTYLTHYTVLTYYIGQRVTRINWDVFEFLCVFIGLTFFSTIMGLVTTLLVERPFMKLQKKYLKF